MRPLSIIGILLIIAGAVVLVLRGIHYTKDRDSVKVGPLEVSAEHRGFIPPVAGAIAVVLGIALVAVGQRRS
ncbi:MAG TPA: hypothetical protein VF166_06895 [Gemmatimonadaceae bacterium]